MGQPGNIDYDALAKQYGATSSTAAPASRTIDYDALAKHYGATSSAWTPVDESLEAKWTPVQEPLAQQSHAEISAHPGGVKQWLTDLESDLRYGGQQTVVGRALKSAGYQGAESLGGMEGSAGKTMISPLTGPIYAAHGVAEAASGHPLRGAGEVFSGIGEAAQIPMMFAAPETSEAAASVPGKVGATFLPSALKAKAGVQFTEAANAARNLVVDISKPGDSVLRINELREAGNYTPQVVRKFLSRVTDPDKAPMAYSEARDYYSTVSRLSADEYNKMTPVMKAAMGEFRVNLGQAIQDTANTAGVGDQYSAAMQGYRTAARNQEWLDKAVKGLKYGAGAAAVGAVGGAAASRFMKLGDIVTGK